MTLDLIIGFCLGVIFTAGVKFVSGWYWDHRLERDARNRRLGIKPE